MSGNPAIFNIEEIPEFINDLASPASKEIGHTLGNIFYTAFYPINYWPERLRIKSKINLDRYEATIKEEVSKIPEDKLKEPELSIAGPALEASKYYIENETLRNMFAKLIASSMNTDKSRYSHQSFVEIIKQLTPLDAENLTYINVNHRGGAPVAKLTQPNPNGSFKVAYINVFLKNVNDDFHLNSTSLSNLNRLGLVLVDYDSALQDDNYYNPIRNHPLAYYYETNQNNQPVKKPFNIVKGTAILTPLGNDFIAACL